MAPDYEFSKTDSPSLWLVSPTSPEAARYLREQSGNEQVWVGNALVIDGNDVEGLAGRLEDDGFRVWV